MSNRRSQVFRSPADEALPVESEVLSLRSNAAIQGLLEAPIAEILGTRDSSLRAQRLKKEVVPPLQALVRIAISQIRQSTGENVLEHSALTARPAYRELSGRKRDLPDYDFASAGIAGVRRADFWRALTNDPAERLYGPSRLDLEITSQGLAVVLWPHVYHLENSDWVNVAYSWLGARRTEVDELTRRFGVRVQDPSARQVSSSPLEARVPILVSRSLPLSREGIESALEAFLAHYPLYRELIRLAQRAAGEPEDEARLPEEAVEPTFVEGARTQVFVNAYERDPAARRRCVEIHGTRCKACGVDLVEVYGEAAAGLIHVHHLVPLADLKRSYRVDPGKDLVPVCPNCHAVIHRGPETPRAVDSVRALVKAHRDGKQVTGLALLANAEPRLEGA